MVVVGAGPVGLTVAIGLALRGLPVVLLDDADRIGEGSRGICYDKRSLEIWDRLGVGDRLVAMGVTWQLGKVYLGNRLVYAFDLLPETGHKMPAFINLQQYAVEKTLIERTHELAAIDLRWRNRVVGLQRGTERVRLTIATPDGPYALDADWVIAADGARSTVRELLGLRFAGTSFDDKFLVADVRMAAELPAERRFWFDPPFHDGQSALMHRQPGNLWRIDLQLGPDADPELEQEPARVAARLEHMLGHRAFELEWVSVYRYACRRLERFVHGCVLFAGDAAHEMSPFGARGGNSGVQDADNLVWKLAAVATGKAPRALLDTYDLERGQAADENLGYSTGATDFIAPRSPASRALRNAVLALAPRAEFARRMVNSGRLSTAACYETPLSTADEALFAGSARLGGAAPDAPLCGGRFLTERLSGQLEVLHMRDGAPPRVPDGVRLTVVGDDVQPDGGLFAERYDATPGATYLLRPDQHLAARWRRYDPAKLDAAIARVLGR